MSFDFKKAYQELYLPTTTPSLIEVPTINYIAVRGHGNPNVETGEYKDSISQLYAIAYTIKMSYKGPHRIENFFEYVVPPLEGFWWQDGVEGIDYSNKEGFNFISVIRLPDFVSHADFEWAKNEASLKKKIDTSKAEFLTVEEGLCVQCLHLGNYDSEPETVRKMHRLLEENNLCLDINSHRLHHEIYLSDPRKTAAERLKTVIRHPVRAR